MTFDGQTYNVLTDEELHDLIISAVYDIKYETGKVDLMDFESFIKDREEK